MLNILFAGDIYFWIQVWLNHFAWVCLKPQAVVFLLYQQMSVAFQKFFRQEWHILLNQKLNNWLLNFSELLKTMKNTLAKMHTNMCEAHTVGGMWPREQSAFTVSWWNNQQWTPLKSLNQMSLGDHWLAYMGYYTRY